ncbi:MAG: pyridoxal 5'-phosphate synthase glutaminase subunit PdxT [Kiritimatiellae bacterium]|nr:pyridoxal 5'-phosphate synthase glutaminase subunit PdxT [Kiritimatiellia bacterium]
MKPHVGVLALQGAFAEQIRAFRETGADPFEIRSVKDLARPLDALVLPGGESTVQGKLLHGTGLFSPLAERIAAGLPVFATCAGLILLAERLEDDPVVWFGVLPVTVRRNAYGRQLGSFATTGTVDGDVDVPMTFIRAPSIVSVGKGVEILSTFQGQPTGVRYRDITALAWHPELTDDRRIFQAFLAKSVKGQ